MSLKVTRLNSNVLCEGNTNINDLIYRSRPQQGIGNMLLVKY